jgi:hypothetical protein
MTQNPPVRSFRLVAHVVQLAAAIVLGLGMPALVAAASVPTPAAPTAAEVQTWVRDLGAPEFAVREHASEHLASAGPVVLPALLAARQSSDPEVVQRADRIIEEWAAEGLVPALLIQLASDSPSIRASAADGLGRQQAQAQTALAALTVAARDADHTVRTAAHDAIKKIQATLNLRLDVTPVVEPSEVGTPAIYRVELSNQGTEAYNNVSVRARLSKALELVHVQGDGKAETVNGRVVTEPRTLEPGHSVRWDIQVKPCQPGETRVKVDLEADGLITPIHYEETAVVAPPRPTPSGN